MNVVTLAAKVEQMQQLLFAHEAESAARKAETRARLDAEAKAEQFRTLYTETLERCRTLELGLVGRKAERLSGNDAQLTISVLGTLLGEREAESKPKPTKKVKEHERRKPTGRKPLPEELPRVDIEVLPDEVRQQGLDAFERSGEEERRGGAARRSGEEERRGGAARRSGEVGEVGEVVERRRASFVVVRVHRPKFVRKDRERNADTAVEIADPPDLPIPRGLAGPSLLAAELATRFEIPFDVPDLPVRSHRSLARHMGLINARAIEGSPADQRRFQAALENDVDALEGAPWGYPSDRSSFWRSSGTPGRAWHGVMGAYSAAKLQRGLHDTAVHFIASTQMGADLRVGVLNAWARMVGMRGEDVMGPSRLARARELLLQNLDDAAHLTDGVAGDDEPHERDPFRWSAVRLHALTVQECQGSGGGNAMSPAEGTPKSGNGSRGHEVEAPVRQRERWGSVGLLLPPNPGGRFR